MTAEASQAAAIARQSYCEAKKDRLAQNQDGAWKITLNSLDLPPHVIAAPMGTRYMIAFVELGDNEEPVSPLGPSASERAKAAYQASSPGDQARARSVMLCRDPDFQAWAQATDEAEAATFIRRSCRVNTRAAFADNPKALETFLALEREYKASHRFHGDRR